MAKLPRLAGFDRTSTRRGGLTSARRFGEGPKWLPLAAMLFVAFLFLPLSLLGSRTFAAVDILEATAPYREAIGREPKISNPLQGDQTEALPRTAAFYHSLRNGRLLLWDDSVAGGTPLGTLPFNSLLSPFSLGYLILPAWYAVGFRVFLALIFSQWFTFLFLRRLGTTRLPAFLAGVAYTFHGTNQVLVHRVDVVFVFPAMLWAMHRLVDRPTPGRAAILAALFAWGWYEGFPAGWIYCVYATFAWGAWLTFRHPLAAGTGWLLAIMRRGLMITMSLSWGVALSAVTLLPLVSEVITRGTLERRQFGSGDHLPGIQLFGLVDPSATGHHRAAGGWSGQNPVESVTHIGAIVMLALVFGLVAAAVGRLRLSVDGCRAWTFFCSLGFVGVVLSFLGGPILSLAYQLPGLAQSSIHRSRFVIGMAAAVMAALVLDAWWRRQDIDRQPAPRLVSVVTLALAVAALILHLGDFLRLAADRGQTERVLVGFAGASALAVVALGAVVRGGPRTVTAGILGTLLLIQLVLPLRGFTPEAPIEDFYTEKEGHRQLRGLLGGDYRFAATDLNYLPNSSQLLGLRDVRGHVLQSPEFRALIEAAAPRAFGTDPLKLFFERGDFDRVSPILDDLSVRYILLGTVDLPFGRLVGGEEWDDWSRKLPETDREPAPGPIAGALVPVKVAGDCASAQVEAVLRQGDRTLDIAARPALDASGEWLSFALTGQALAAGDGYELLIRSSSSVCHVAVGIVRNPGGTRLARRLLVEDPGQPVRLVATEQSWIYERPRSWPLVSVHQRWRSFPSQEALLDYVSMRPAGDDDVAAIVGSVPTVAPGGQPARILRRRLDGDRVDVVTDGPDRSLLVLSQNNSEGWSVRVDERSAGIVSVDGALMGVFVPEGRHHVEFQYRPRAFVIGRFVTLGALGMIGIASFWEVRARRRRSTDIAAEAC